MVVGGNPKLKMSKKLKIAFICNIFPNISETFIRNQVDYFIRHGHSVDIIATGYTRKNNLFKKYKNVYGMKSNTQKLLFFPFFFLTMLLTNPILLLKSLNFFKYGKEALFLKIFYPFLFVKNKDYDILMCHFGDSGIVGSFIKKEVMPNSKLVCMFHGADIRRGIDKGGRVYSELFISANLILSISRYNFKYLKRWGARNLVMHPVGIDTIKYKLREKIRRKNKIRILTIGRLVKEKGYFYAIDAVKKLIKANPKKVIEYSIIGEGYLRHKIEGYIKINKLQKNIFLHGEKEGKDILKFYKNADIFLLTSINEALPVVVMEAQSFGIPIIATDVGSIKEEIIEGKSGFVVPSKNINKIYEKLQWLMDNEDKWDDFGRVGRAHIKNKYEITMLNKKLEKLFYRLKKNDAVKK